MPNSAEILSFLEQARAEVHQQYILAATRVIISLGGGLSLAVFETITRPDQETQNLSGYMPAAAFILVGFCIYLTSQEENACKLMELDENIELMTRITAAEQPLQKNTDDTTADSACCVAVS